MTWEQKLAALNAIAEHTLVMRSPGDWFVSATVDVVGDGVLIGAFGNGQSPQRAVEDHWRLLVDDIRGGKGYLRAAQSGRVKYVKWNGFMWADYSHVRAAARATAG